MKNRSMSRVFTAVFFAVLVALLFEDAGAFTTQIKSIFRRTSSAGVRRAGFAYRCMNRSSNRNSLLFAFPPESESDSVMNLLETNGESGTKNEDDLGILDELETQPFDWRQMQQAMGINIFTILLAASIVFFLSMNAMLGPGWLGAKVGIPGTGSIQEVSPSLPGSINLNKPEFRL